MQNEIITVPSRPIQTVETIKSRVQLVSQCMKDIMHEGEHYGKVPGCGDKPTLLKPGAEKLCFLFGLEPRITTECIRIVDYPEGHREYTVIIPFFEINSGLSVGTGVGSCSTLESKYRYRNAERKCPECGKASIIKGKEEFGGGWICFQKKGGCGKKFKADDPAIINQETGKIAYDDPADYYNTCLKMAKKRALVDGTLNITGASDMFTQDIEELPVEEDVKPSKPQKKTESPKTSKESAPEPKSQDDDTVKLSEAAKNLLVWCQNNIAPQFDRINEMLQDAETEQFTCLPHLYNAFALFWNDKTQQKKCYNEGQQFDWDLCFAAFTNWRKEKKASETPKSKKPKKEPDVPPAESTLPDSQTITQMFYLKVDEMFDQIVDGLRKAGIDKPLEPGKLDKELEEWMHGNITQDSIAFLTQSTPLFIDSFAKYLKKKSIENVTGQIPPG